jgi:hypothetical protein
MKDMTREEFQRRKELSTFIRESKSRSAHRAYGKGHKEQSVAATLNDLKGNSPHPIHILRAPDLWELRKNGIGAMRGPIGLPSMIFSFFGALLNEGRGQLENQSILDPHVTQGGLLREAGKILHPLRTVGFYSTQEDLENKLDLLSDGETVEEYRVREHYHADETGVIDCISSPTEVFDIVVSAPSLQQRSPGQRHSSFQECKFDNGVEVSSHPEAVEFLLSALHQNELGIGFYLLTAHVFDRSFNDNGISHPVNNLDRFGMFIDAIFWLPTMRQGGMYLVVVKRGNSPKSMFIGKAKKGNFEDPWDEFSANSELAKKYWSGEWREPKNRTAHNPTSGIPIDRSEFVGFEKHLKRFELTACLNALSYPTQKLKEIASIHEIKRQEIENIVSEKAPKVLSGEPHFNSNSIFIRRRAIQSSPRAVESLEVILSKEPNEDDGKIDRRISTDWIRLEIDPQATSKTALVRYFESALGLQAMGAEANVTGSLRAIESIGQIKVCIPNSLEEQQNQSEVWAMLEQLREDLKKVQFQLDYKPDQHVAALSSIEGLLRKEDLADWSETLPFPLANILWRHESAADTDVRARCEALQHFFEGLTIFLTAIVIGAMSQSEVYEEQRDQWKEKLGANGLDLKRSTWGTWLAILEISVKRVRSDINNTDPEKGLTRNDWQRNFACGNLMLLNVLVGKPLLRICREASYIRNEFAHSGVKSPIELNHWLKKYESKLSEVKSLFGYLWKDYPLVQSLSMRETNGEWIVSARKVVGSRQPFPQEEYALQSYLKGDALHLLDPVSGYHCPLPQIVRLGSTPHENQDAFYFFNNSADGEGTFVSYSYEGQPTLSWPLEECGLLSDLLG